MTNPEPEPRISVAGLVKSFGDKRVLDGVDLDVMTGESVVVVGGSGAGKTVLIKHMIGLMQPDSGRYAFGFDLWTTDRRFFRIEGVDAPWGKTSSQTEVVTVTNPDGSSETTVTEKFTTEDKLVLNAQIGYRLFPTTQLRAGIFESTGGFGVDHSVMVGARPLRLTFEAYDFNRALADDPHLRLEGRYYVTEHVFVLAGWDDPLYDRTSSVLFGGGVVWTDEDLKYSLGLAAGALN